MKFGRFLARDAFDLRARRAGELRLQFGNGLVVFLALLERAAMPAFPATAIPDSDETRYLASAAARTSVRNSPPSTCEELTNITLSLRQRVDADPGQRFRLVGVGLSNFREPEEAPAQPALFD